MCMNFACTQDTPAEYLTLAEAIELLHHHNSPFVADHGQQPAIWINTGKLRDVKIVPAEHQDGIALFKRATLVAVIQEQI